MLNCSYIYSRNKDSHGGSSDNGDKKYFISNDTEKQMRREENIGLSKNNNTKSSGDLIYSKNGHKTVTTKYQRFK